MMFAQLTHRESLRDIEICLRSLKKKLFLCGFRGKISKSTLAEANNKRDWRIYRDFAGILIKEAKKLYLDEPFGVELKNSVYAFDSSIISLCLSVFPWAKFRTTKAGIKMHTQLDLHGNIPVFIDLSDAAQSDSVALDNLIIEAGSVYILDRGYVDFKRLYYFVNNLAFFIVRAKKTVADLYKSRWQVELFFKWIKQHLKIKSFFGTSRNAVYSKIWIAISAYVLIAIVKKRLKIDKSLYSILQFLSIALFHKIPIFTALNDIQEVENNSQNYKQLNLFDY